VPPVYVYQFGSERGGTIISSFIEGTLVDQQPWL
jgi:hypothetical protein